MTGCVFSKACNFLVTVGTDCDGKILAVQFLILFFVLNMFPVGGFLGMFMRHKTQWYVSEERFITNRDVYHATRKP